MSFGLRSAPKIFSAFVDALEWIFCHVGVTFILHFLDDYLTAGKPHTRECEQNLAIIRTVHTWACR